MATLSLAISLFLLSLAAQHLQAAPATTAAVSLVTVSTEPPKEVCDASQWHQYCSCHIPTFVLPNPRQQDLKKNSKSDYFSDAAGEFSNFLPLLNSGCHEKLLTLLCFFYFPLCFESQSGLQTIFPCKELCLDVTDECGKELRNTYNLTWGSHFDCENYEYKGEKLYKEFDPSNVQCVNHSLPFTGKTCDRPTTQPATTPKPTTPAVTTPAPTTQPPPCSQCEEEKSSKSCGSFRNAINSNTFVNNKGYNFAAKVRFVNYTTHDCRSALNFTLLDQYDLKSSEDCTSVPPAIPSSFLFLGEHRGCERKFGRGEDDCFKSHLTMKKGESLELGETYLIAGTHELAEDNSDQFLAVNRPLITLWNKTVKNRISNAISKGNDGRCPSDS